MTDEQSIAEAFEENKQWNEALNKYKEIYHKDKSLYILSKILWCYSRLCDYESAKKCAKVLIKKEPNNPKWHYMMGYQYYMEKDWKNAIAYFEKSLAINPNYFVVLYRISYAYLQCTGEYMKLTKSEYWKAIGYLNKSHDIWNKFSEDEIEREKNTYYHICFLNGKAFMLIPNKNEDAITYFKRALSIKDDLDCRYNLCKCLYYNKEYQSAHDELPSSKKYYIVELLAQIEYKLKNYDEAIRLINNQLKRRKKDYLYCLLADIYIEQSKYKDAYKAVKYALNLNDNNHKNHFKLAVVYCKLGLYSHAIEEIEKAKNLKQKRFNAEYLECEKLSSFIDSKLTDDYIEDEKLYKSLTENRNQGIVTNFNSSKKFGFTYVENKKVFIHISNVVSGYIKNGAHISFDIEQTDKGYNAINIAVE